MKRTWLGMAAAVAIAASTGCGGGVSTASGGNGGGSSNGQGGGAHSSASGGNAKGSSASTATDAIASSSTGTGVATAECQQDTDCQLVNDCCNCLGIPSTQTPPNCGLPNCLQSTCSADFFTGNAICRLGHCAAGFDCDPADVACGTPRPNCPNPGDVPMVSGACWGACVPASQCTSVGTCADCGSNDACVFFGGGVQSTTCIKIPPECGGTANCACMGHSLCGGVPCGDSNGQLVCEAP